LLVLLGELFELLARDARPIHEFLGSLVVLEGIGEIAEHQVALSLALRRHVVAGRRAGGSLGGRGRLRFILGRLTGRGAGLVLRAPAALAARAPAVVGFADGVAAILAAGMGRSFAVVRRLRSIRVGLRWVAAGARLLRTLALRLTRLSGPVVGSLGLGGPALGCPAARRVRRSSRSLVLPRLAWLRRLALAAGGRLRALA